MTITSIITTILFNGSKQILFLVVSVLEFVASVAWTFDKLIGKDRIDDEHEFSLEDEAVCILELTFEMELDTLLLYIETLEDAL
jgi:hypothetical protein